MSYVAYSANLLTHDDRREWGALVKDKPLAILHNEQTVPHVHVRVHVVDKSP